MTYNVFGGTLNPAQLNSTQLNSRANVQGQRSFGSEDRVETNGRTDRRTDGRTEAIALPPSLMRSAMIAYGL